MILNMNKKVLIIGIIILIVVIVIGGYLFLNKQDENIQINNEELATQISQSGSFEDSIAKVDNEIVMEAYGFSNEEINEIVSYQGSGATSEELVILQATDKSQLNSIKDKISNRLTERKEAFESYLPEEVFKIDDHLLDIKGNYVILCISNDSSKVEEVINNYIKDRG